MISRVNTVFQHGHHARSQSARVVKLRQGSYFPGFLEARKTSEQAVVLPLRLK
jgi:transposase-like protein